MNEKTFLCLYIVFMKQFFDNTDNIDMIKEIWNKKLEEKEECYFELEMEIKNKIIKNWIDIFEKNKII